MKRSRSPLKLHKSPLVMVLAQVRISHVAKMGDYVDDVQEQLRQSGFPRFEEGRAHEILLRPGLQPEIREHSRWEFQNKERSAAIIVMQNAIVLHTNSYDTFDHFAKSLRLALEVIGDAAKPALVERLGLRYVDLIRPEAGESWTAYLKEGLHGLRPEAIGMTEGLQRHETVGTTKAGQLVVRCVQSKDGGFLPADLSPSTLDYSTVSVRPGELVTLLDLDHFSPATRDFDVDEVMAAMWELHENLDVSFRDAVTEHALKKWEAQSL
ncbi:MAG TPA: TIGR04255 family protein [Labilithrix sp.]|nr:TIGR04255 family protein [Labilithrix sp.]